MALISYCTGVFKDPQDENKIGIDGIQQFCDDLALDPASISVLIIAWKFRAATQCEFSKQEFMDGMTELGCVCSLHMKSVHCYKSHCGTDIRAPDIAVNRNGLIR